MSQSVLSDAQWAWIADRYLEGYSQIELAKFTHVNKETIRRGLIRLGIRPEAKYLLPDLEERRQEYLHLECGNDG